MCFDSYFPLFVCPLFNTLSLFDLRATHRVGGRAGQPSVDHAVQEQPVLRLPSQSPHPDPAEPTGPGGAG